MMNLYVRVDAAIETLPIGEPAEKELLAVCTKAGMNPYAVPVELGQVWGELTEPVTKAITAAYLGEGYPPAKFSLEAYRQGQLDPWGPDDRGGD